MTLDKQLDEILEKYAVDNFLQTAQVQAHIDAKKAIKQLIEEVQTESYKKGYIDKGIDSILNNNKVEKL